MSIYSERDFGEFVLPLALKFGDHEISNRRMKLLEAVHQTGSISGAAKAIGMTYKAAWDAIDAVNNRAAKPVVMSQHGGAGGGGAVLSDYGVELITAFSKLEAMQSELTSLFERHQIEHLTHDLRSILMKTSARNTFSGTIKSLTKGAVNAEVILGLQGNDEITAIITNGSVETMELAVGKPAFAMVKSSFVIVSAEPMKTSARNQLCGIVERVTDGAVNAEVVIKLEGGNLVTATITEGSTHSLGLKEGGKACAIIKASHVIIGVDN